MEELVSYIVKNFVEKPECLEITSERAENLTIIKIKADKDDLGRIIGKNGKIINSIRIVLRALVSRSGEKIIIKVGE